MIAVVKAEITNAKAAIAGYREEVQADANVVIAAAETTVSAQESSVAKDFADGKLGDISGKKLVNNILSDFPFLTRTELTFQKYNIIGQ